MDTSTAATLIAALSAGLTPSDIGRLLTINSKATVFDRLIPDSCFDKEQVYKILLEDDVSKYDWLIQESNINVKTLVRGMMEHASIDLYGRIREHPEFKCELNSPKGPNPFGDLSIALYARKIYRERCIEFGRLIFQIVGNHPSRTPRMIRRMIKCINDDEILCIIPQDDPHLAKQILPVLFEKPSIDQVFLIRCISERLYVYPGCFGVDAVINSPVPMYTYLLLKMKDVLECDERSILNIAFSDDSPKNLSVLAALLISDGHSPDITPTAYCMLKRYRPMTLRSIGADPEMMMGDRYYFFEQLCAHNVPLPQQVTSSGYRDNKLCRWIMTCYLKGETLKINILFGPNRDDLHKWYRASLCFSWSEEKGLVDER